MFTIEQAVENWKNDLRQKQTLIESDIEELESHLQEEMERLTPLGLSEEESFLIAARRIGDTTQMAAEFAKVNAAAIWKTRFFWMIVGILLLKLFTSCSNFLSYGVALLGHQFTGLSWLIIGILSAVLQTIVLLIFFYVFYVAAIKTALFRQIPRHKVIGTMITLVLLSYLLSTLSTICYRLLFAGLYGAEQLGQFYLGSSYSYWGLAVLWPALWLALLLWLMPRKTQTT